MRKKISRRDFLKAGLGSALGSAGVLAAAATPVVARAETADKKQTELATLLDLSRCIGCEACVDACYQSNQAKYPNPKKPFPKMLPPRVPVMDWSDKKDVTDRLTPYNWLFIQRATVTDAAGQELEVNIPRRCMHCSNPPCVKLCPFGAAQQTDNGISRIDDQICLGGSKCKAVCPWHIPERQTGVGIYLDLLPSLAGNGVMYKCDRCYQKVAKGELPACIEVCPEAVQTIGPRDEIIKKAHRLAKEMNGYIYGETENGGTNTIYVSPVPFDQLNKAVEKGPGQPHLKAVADTMADGNNLLTALLVAPVAGVAAAAAKIYKATKNTDQKVEEEAHGE